MQTATTFCYFQNVKLRANHSSVCCVLFWECFFFGQPAMSGQQLWPPPLPHAGYTRYRSMVCNVVLLILDAAIYRGTPSNRLCLPLCCIVVGNQHFGDGLWPFAPFQLSHWAADEHTHVSCLYMCWWQTSVERFAKHFHFPESLFYSPSSIRSGTDWTGTAYFILLCNF